MKELNSRDVAAIKRTAQIVQPLVAKKEKAFKKIADLNEEINMLQSQIDGFETGIKSMTGGYSSEDLIVRVVETTNSVDKDGNPIKVTKYMLRYPDTILPVEKENVQETEIKEETIF